MDERKREIRRLIQLARDAGATAEGLAANLEGDAVTIRMAIDAALVADSDGERLDELALAADLGDYARSIERIRTKLAALESARLALGRTLET